MDRIDWKTARISAALGLPRLDPKYLPPQALIALKERMSEVEDVAAVVLYGSVVRGEASPKSDVDILIVPLKKEKAASLEAKVAKVLREVEKEHNMKIGFSAMVYTGKEDSYFIWEALKDGVVLYSRPEAAIHSVQNLMPYALISYTCSGLSESAKKRLQRFLFKSKSGVQINKNDKMEYIAPGVFLLNLDRARRATDFFDEMRVQYGLMKIWR
ncbi:MAG: nucleotidyltransferase domain-containing protein [Thermoplasmata archaeon]